MPDFAAADFPRSFALLAFAGWLGIAALNNVRDRGTNVYLLGLMFAMTLLKDDPMMGNGLKHRAITRPGFHAGALTVIVTVQIIVAAALLLAGAAMVARWIGVPFGDATALANLALAGFGSIWFFFLSGGLWFGYWMKQAPVQQVHLTMALVTLALFLLVNI